jgi:hypothetical protein
MAKSPSGMNEFVRKRLVGLKRKPQNIPLFCLILSFVYYSFNLTTLSDTTAYVQGNNMGLTGFAIMLFSVLMIVCCMNAFPYRKPAHKPMLLLLCAMLVLVIFCEVYYVGLISSALTREVNPIEITDSLTYILKARSIAKTHVVLLVLSAVAVIALPVYSKWIRSINTSIEVEGNGEMGKIDIGGEDA